MDLASCTTSAVTCDDTPPASGVWPLVALVVLVLLAGIVLWWVVRSASRRRRRVRVPQRRAHVSAAGELLSLQERPRG